MADKTDLVKKIQKLFGGKAKVWTDQDEVDPDKFLPVPNRQEKRRYQGQRGKLSGTGKVHDALRLGPRPKAKGGTGNPQWFKVMKYEAARRASLEKVTMDRLEPAVGRIALDLYAAGYRTVWDVTQVEDINEFLKHGQAGNPEHGIRISDLQKLRTYLTQQRVPVKWRA